MTTTATTDSDLALVIDLFGNASVEPDTAPAMPAAKPRPRRPRAIGDTSSVCQGCDPTARAAVRYDTCVVCSPPAQIALG